MTSATGVPRRVKGPYDSSGGEEKENRIQVKMFLKSDLWRIQRISFKLLYYSKKLYQSTVSAKLLDQSENIVAAEESMLIESVGHYYKKQK